MNQVIKNNGKRVEFNINKLRQAIDKTNVSCNNVLQEDDIVYIINKTVSKLQKINRDVNTDEISDILEQILSKVDFNVAKSYIEYRYEKREFRNKSEIDARINEVLNNTNEEVKQENSNKNPTILSVQRDYVAGEYSRYYTNKYIIPKDLAKAHEEGIIHIHDEDYMIHREHNCCLVNLEDMLQNGTNISGYHIDKPHSFRVACTLASQISAVVASNQYGGQTITLSHLAPFVEVSRKAIKERLNKIEGLDTKLKNKILQVELEQEVRQGIQSLQYEYTTLQTTNGQAPFITVFMYLNEVKDEQTKKDLAWIIQIMLEQRIKGVKDTSGIWVNPSFPKLIYVLDKDNIKEGTEYFWLTKLAAECSAKRMVPDYISAKVMKELKGDVYSCMGCRSFLTPDRFSDEIEDPAHALNFKKGKHKYYGRFNQGVCTINLPDVALSSKGDEDKFWQLLDERCEMCHRVLQIRHERLKGTLSDVSPLMWQDGALARLKPGETIDNLLYHGYSTISLGYAGLYECVYAMIHESHTSEKGKKLGIKIMKFLNDKCAKWKKEEDIDYSIYGTPIESTTYKFAKCLQKRFGIIKEVTDHNYITNSYHVNVRENISAFDKLTLEGEYQALSPGGAVSYVELPNMQNNLDAIIKILQHIYNSIMYAEINLKQDICRNCGFEGQINIVKDETGKLVWECPNCHNRNQEKMYVSRRTCGYLGSQYWNQGRTQEIDERVEHVGIKEMEVKEEN